MKKQVVIIGGGASGLVAAISAAREGAQVTILEHMDRVGKKILSTGNGRCNMTNLVMEAECYRSSQPDFPMQVIDRFSIWDTLTFFDELGIITKNKNGYIYPNSEQASAVLDTLCMEIRHLGIDVRTGVQVRSVRKKKKGGFAVMTDRGEVSGDVLILAAGSKAAPKTGSDGSGYGLAKSLGHRIIPPLPALVQLRCAGKFFKQIAGVRCEARVTLLVDGRAAADDLGEVQLTDYGISGIPTFQVSRYASVALAQKKKVTAVLDFLPSKTEEEADHFIRQRAELVSYRASGEMLTGVVHKKLAAVLLKMAGAPMDVSVGEVPPAVWERLARLLKGFSVEVTASNSFEQAQVCCGGVDVRDVDPATMESRLVPGLYLAGELLDVDGICGGYNLQWAWSTGMIAGSCAGRV